ncbi:MAG: protein translocase subunit SecD [Verrucomicrobia bacterium]|nr:protein translocase subunit SecD [Verrucomicrobiota bacterium]
MFKRNLWKLSISFAIVLWAVWTLVPVNDQPFPDYAKSKARAKTAEFAALLKEATARNAATPATSEFVALKQIAKERKIDLSQYYPNLDLGDVKNLERKNNILLDYLLKESKGQLQLGLDLKGGVAFTLEADEKSLAALPEWQRQEKLAKAIQIISDRVNGLGVAEPLIRPIGENRIEVQLPGVNTKDNPEVVDSVKKPARLDFRIVHPSLSPQPGVDTPPGYEILSLEQEGRGGELSFEEIFVKQRPEMTGEAIEDAFARPDEYGKPEIILNFTNEGKSRFAEVTGEIAQGNERYGRLGRLAIVLDGKLYSAPTVREQINSNTAQITGSFTDREAVELSNVLNNPLDVPLQVKEQYEVGPTLATDAIASGKLAFIISTSLTVIFVFGIYLTGGLIAALGMLVNVLVTLGVMSMIGATLSMPGIAGIVLTLAMSVDSNILIFERMREELKMGKTLPAALEAGFDKAWSAILDSNVTTLAVAAIMIWLGTGPVKGFGVTLAIGIFTTMFAAVVVSKLVMEALILPGIIKRMPMVSILQNTNFDFLKVAKVSFIASWVIVIVGVAVTVYRGNAIYGIDFAGGDTVTLGYKQEIEVGTLRKAAESAGFKDASFAYQQQIGTDNKVLKATTRFDEGKALVAKLQTAFPQAGLDAVGEARIGPSVGKEIQANALWAVLASLVAIMIYVAFRFEMGYGIGAVVSTVHDVLMTIGIFVLFDRQFNAPMVAAILLIVGYSINDTIVVFDRIREELALNPNTKLRDIINRSLNLTLSRTVITGGTTLMTAITLIIVTTGEVNDIAFTLLIGVITGTFSSLFIASPVFYWWHKGDRKHVEKHQDVKPTYEWTGSSKASQ